MSDGERAVRLHPLAIAALPLPAIVAALLAQGVGVGLACVLAGLLVSFSRGPRFAFGVLAMIAGMTLVLWLGFAASLPRSGDDVIPWLPFRPPLDTALVALRGALRIVAVMALFVATAARIRWNVLADSLVERFRVPYRLVDVVGLGGRFAVRIHADIRAARSLARLRARGRPLRATRLLTGLTVPVLMGAFRHADALTVAMEARGFGARPERTAHDAEALRGRDGLAVAVVWAGTVAIALRLESLPF